MADISVSCELGHPRQDENYVSGGSSSRPILRKNCLILLK
jgi:hypothetical protein